MRPRGSQIDVVDPLQPLEPLFPRISKRCSGGRNSSRLGITAGGGRGVFALVIHGAAARVTATRQSRRRGLPTTTLLLRLLGSPRGELARSLSTRARYPRCCGHPVRRTLGVSERGRKGLLRKGGRPSRALNRRGNTYFCAPIALVVWRSQPAWGAQGGPHRRPRTTDSA